MRHAMRVPANSDLLCRQLTFSVPDVIDRQTNDTWGELTRDTFDERCRAR